MVRVCCRAKLEALAISSSRTKPTVARHVFQPAAEARPARAAWNTWMPPLTAPSNSPRILIWIGHAKSMNVAAA